MINLGLISWDQASQLAAFWSEIGQGAHSDLSPPQLSLLWALCDTCKNA